MKNPCICILIVAPPSAETARNATPPHTHRIPPASQPHRVFPVLTRKEARGWRRPWLRIAVACVSHCSIAPSLQRKPSGDLLYRRSPRPRIDIGTGPLNRVGHPRTAPLARGGSLCGMDGLYMHTFVIADALRGETPKLYAYVCIYTRIADHTRICLAISAFFAYICTYMCTLLDWQSKQLGLFLLHRLTSGSQRGGAKAGSHFLNNFLSKVHRCIVCIIGDFAIGRFATARFAVSRGCAILSHASACNCTCTGAGNQVLLLAALSERCCL